MFRNFISELYVKSFFYHKPKSLGEGLKRVKKSLGVKANAKDYDIRPGVRSYEMGKKIKKQCWPKDWPIGWVSFDTCDFSTKHKCLDKGVKSWTDTSRLIISVKDACSNIKTKYIVDYNITHDNIGKEVTPYRYRDIAKIQYDHKTITTPTITF